MKIEEIVIVWSVYLTEAMRPAITVVVAAHLWLGLLWLHIAAKHSDRILKCDHCDYQTKWRQNYNSHKRTAHTITV